MNKIITGGYIDILYGLFWGDEGKGKIIDCIIGNYHVVIRANGGSNAGHTIYINGHKVVLHLLPSGIASKDAALICGSGMVIHPDELIKEISDMLSFDIELCERLYISDQATIATAYDKIMDMLRETTNSTGKNGSTKKGIAFSYANDALHIGLRYSDLYLSEEEFQNKYQVYRDYQEKIIEALYPTWLIQNRAEVDRLEGIWIHGIRTVRKKVNIRDTVRLANELLKAGKNILIEGAQATFLDTRMGFYPHVTSSHTIPQMLLGYSGLPIHNVRDTIAVTKWYMTKVGDGDFPGQMDEATETLFREAGGEVGATTGRQRMCGWHNNLLYEHALMLTHPTKIYINKFDVCPVDEVRVIIQHLKGEEFYEGSLSTLSGITRTQHLTFPAWKLTEKMDDKSKLPSQLQEYLSYIKQQTDQCSLGSKIVAIGTGPERHHMLQL
jgi:adenylosuccinate synthase